MKKYLLNLICLLLVFSIAIGVAPAYATDNISATALRRSIEHTYFEALEWAKRTSFFHDCGTCVSYQLYTLGITTKMGEVNKSGKEVFDYFAGQTKSSGGYTIAAYPASEYTLENALNAICSTYGAEVYNIVVGFDWFKASDPDDADLEKYGHVMLIHAIINGRVYYSESFPASTEGTAKTEEIAKFCSHYTSSNYTFDGAIYFGGVRHPLENDDEVIRTLHHHGPTDMAVGDNFKVNGMVYSRKSKLTRVRVVVFDSTGEVVLSKYGDTRDGYYYNLGRMESYLDFSTLTKGTYTYVVSVTNAAGNTLLYQLDFNVGAVSTAEDVISLTGGNWPETLHTGESFTPAGTLKSAVTNLLYASVLIRDAAGETVSRIDKNVRAKTFDLSKIDTTEVFTTLTPGTYTYVAGGRNAKGYQTVLEKEFTVEPANEVTFFLPSDLTEIESDAFSGIGAESVVIHNSVTSIAGDPFTGSSVTTIYGYPGSAAETMADTYGYTFVEIDDTWIVENE